MRAHLLLVLFLSAGSAAAAIPSGCQEDYSTCKEDCSIEFGGSGRAIKQLTQCLADCQENVDLCANRHSSLKDLPPGVVADEVRPTRSRSEPSRKKAKKKDREEDPFGDDDEPAPRKPRGGDPYADLPPDDAKGGTNRKESYQSSREEVPPAPSEPPVNIPRRGTSSRANAEEAVLGSSAEGPKRSGYRASDVAPEPEAKSGGDDLEPMDAKPEPAPAPVAKSGTKAAPVKPAAAPVKPEPVKPPPTVAASSEEKDPLLDDEPAVLPAPPPTRQPATTTTKAAPRPTPPPEPKKDISEWDPNGD
ncbi:hypothetical protein [Pyxidicoccus trucidator]|uniref:hypothetical protein n=1 Tax=Pyxidicoccus trucidator TaxID=2709662 RepID=UPI0013DCACF6|nr:hypothetical protein [Pyxidicoccus trucidator]